MSTSRRTQADGNAKRFVFTLTPPVFFASILVLFLGMAWVFILGIVIGRGYSPENTIPELAALMPAANSAGAVTANGTSSNPAIIATPATDIPAATVTTPEAQVSPVIAAEDLSYQQTLQSSTPTAIPAVPPASTTTAAPAASGSGASSAPDKFIASIPSTQGSANPVPQAAAPTPAQTPPKPTPVSSSIGTGSGRFLYTYQVAAFRDMPSAEILKKRLENDGFTVTVEQVTDQDKQWFKLLVPQQGTPEEIKNFRSSLSKYGIDGVILRSKSPL